jgi:hypothetical protein
MSRPNSAFAVKIDAELFDDCQDERPTGTFRDGITVELAAIEAIAGPFIVALAYARAAHANGSLADMKFAFEQLAEKSERIGGVRARATYAAAKLSGELRRNPRVRG